MSTYQHPAYALAQTVLDRLDAKYRTLGSFSDPEEMHSELDYLIGRYAGNHCNQIEFYDDSYSVGALRHFEYMVWTPIANGYIDRDEDGNYADAEVLKIKIMVPVRLDMTLELIARNIAKEVRDIENNVLA